MEMKDFENFNKEINAYLNLAVDIGKIYDKWLGGGFGRFFAGKKAMIEIGKTLKNFLKEFNKITVVAHVEENLRTANHSSEE